MRTPASIAHHPVHAMLVAPAIGLLLFSLIGDLLYASGLGGAAWTTVALYTLGGGVVFALAAAVPGLIDLLSISSPPAKRVGIWHMSVNLVAVVLFAASFALRLGGAPGAILPIVAAALGVGLLGVGGWLGGELVYVHGTGVASSAPPASEPPAGRVPERLRAVGQ